MIAPVRGISPALASLWALAITAVSVGAKRRSRWLHSFRATARVRPCRSVA